MCSLQALNIPKLILGPEPQPIFSQPPVSWGAGSLLQIFFNLGCQSPTQIPGYAYVCHP